MFQLDVYEEKLNLKVKKKELSEETAKYYLGCLKRLNKECQDRKSGIENGIRSLCKNSSQVLKYVAAVRNYERVVLGAPKLLLYGDALNRLTHGELSHPECGKELKFSEETYFKKINRLNNTKLKLAYRLQYASGLRIKEISNLKKRDFYFADGEMTLNVRNGKGGKQRMVTVETDPYLYEKLQNHISGMDDEERVFYSRSYLEKKAVEHSMETHDLRRVNARQRFRRRRLEGTGKREARRYVGRELGHDKTTTTNLYLGKAWKEEKETADAESEH